MIRKADISPEGLIRIIKCGRGTFHTKKEAIINGDQLSCVIKYCKMGTFQQQRLRKVLKDPCDPSTNFAFVLRLLNNC